MTQDADARSEVDIPSRRRPAAATPSPGDASLASLSVNQRTIRQWTTQEMIEACARHGIPAIGLWREQVAETGLSETVRLVEDAGLSVSSLCRAGFLTASSREDRVMALDETKRAIDEAAALSAACLPIVAGGLPEGSNDLAGARLRFADAFDRLVPYAVENDVRLAVEPLHPLFCADRSVVMTLAEALDLVQDYPVEHVGVVVDSYNVWWDPGLDEGLRRAGDRIASYQVSDWILPLAEDVLLSRGMMGDGYIDLPALTAGVASAGYTGHVEVEIFNAEIWDATPEDVLTTVMRRHSLHTMMPG